MTNDRFGYHANGPCLGPGTGRLARPRWRLPEFPHGGVASYRTSRRFGDPDLFRWLALDGHEHLESRRSAARAGPFDNGLDASLRRKKARAVYTPPDPRLHPRWSLYEAPGGSNLRNYDLPIHDGKIAVNLPLLSRDGKLEESAVTIQLAPSGQMESPRWNVEPEGDPAEGKRLLFRSASQDFSAALRAVNSCFCRRHLENRKSEELGEGQVGPIWLKAVLEVDSQAPPGWLDARGRLLTPAAVHHFKTGLAKTRVSIWRGSCLACECFR